MIRKRLLLRVAAAVGLVLGAAGCDGPAVPSTISGEPNCETFQLGGVKMKAGLRHPVRLRVLSGKDVIATVMVNGIPKGSAPTRFLLPDTTAEYDLEWTQCASERAPSEASENGPRRGDPTSHYECGDGKPYATTKHSIKSGDASTHTIAIEPPPDTVCWEGGGSTGGAAGSASASATASAMPSAEPSASAEAEPSASASSAPSASASASASAAASASSAPSARPATK